MAIEKMTPDAATARIEALKADKTFRDRINANDSAALAEWRSLHLSATGTPETSTAGAEKARHEIQDLVADPGFRKKLIDGNVEARARWDALNKAAVS